MEFMRKLIGGEEPASAPDSSACPEAAPVPCRLEVGWHTDAGCVRDHNEDAVLVVTAAQDGDGGMPSFGLLVLADGMGGHQSGEVASSVAVRVAAHHITGQFYLPSLLDHARNAGQPALTEILTDAVQAANRAVSKEAPGSGTTLTCALILGRQAYIAHVGDSRAYNLVAGELRQITHDHSVVDRLVEAGQLTPDEAALHPQKNVLYRAVGQSDTVEVDTHIRQVPPGTDLLLCSDGLWGLVSEAQIIDIVESASSLQGACHDLVAAANEAGGRDNITVILWQSPPD